MMINLPPQAPDMPPDERIDVVVQLTPRHHAYLAARAAAHGEPPARHLETILRQFKAHHDSWSPAPDALPYGVTTTRRA